MYTDQPQLWFNWWKKSNLSSAIICSTGINEDVTLKHMTHPTIVGDQAQPLKAMALQKNNNNKKKRKENKTKQKTE